MHIRTTKQPRPKIHENATVRASTLKIQEPRPLQKEQAYKATLTYPKLPVCSWLYWNHWPMPVPRHWGIKITLNLESRNLLKKVRCYYTV